MSKATQMEFVRLVDKYYLQYQKILKLDRPSIRNDGYISTATMPGTGGFVEIRCGPAEYHAEIFVSTINDHKRWNLADLMSMERVRNWMLQNRPDTSGKSRLESEIDCAFSLLAIGLKAEVGFAWICCSE